MGAVGSVMASAYPGTLTALAGDDVSGIRNVLWLFRERMADLKRDHPRAVLAVLRDGEKGFDPAHPDKVYAGWKDAYWTSHGPDAMILERTTNRGKQPTQEIFMRHRSPLMRVELGSIPSGAAILAAQLVIVRARRSTKRTDSPRRLKSPPRHDSNWRSNHVDWLFTRPRRTKRLVLQPCSPSSRASSMNVGARGIGCSKPRR